MVNRPWQIFKSTPLDRMSSLDWKPLFRSSIAAQDEGLIEAAGVYVIASKLRKTYRIRYIGMTHNQGFEAEIFSQANKTKVWDILEKERPRQIQIWLFAKPHSTRSGFTWAKTLRPQSLELEKLLIMLAKGAGHDLINNMQTKAADGIAVVGMFGVKSPKGPKPEAIRSLVRTLKLGA